jgi:hypothetical protein
MAVQQLALLTNLFYRCANLHWAHLSFFGWPPVASLPSLSRQSPAVNNFVIRPRPGSWGETTTSTRSPGRSRTKLTALAAPAWARISRRSLNRTRHLAWGSSARTSATTRFRFRPASGPCGLTASSEPTDHPPSPPHSARSGPSRTRPSPPPSNGLASTCYRRRRRLPSAQSRRPCLL